MPLILTNNGFDLFVWNLKTHTHSYQPYAIYYNLIKDLAHILFKHIFALNLFKSFCLTSSEGIQQRRKYYGSLDDTIITIEADESTPLLADHLIWPDNNNNSNQSDNESEKPTLKYGVSSWSFGSSNASSNGSDYSAYSTKSFKSHFTELRVLLFALILAAALSIAIYLLVIESRLPSITLSLDLVSHDIWSHKTIPKFSHLQHNNVDHIILMQTGNSNCDTSGECLKVLKEMQAGLALRQKIYINSSLIIAILQNKKLNQPEELPYNFLIGGDGQAYEVRGWQYESSMKGVPQERSLVIGVIGNFDHNTPQKVLLQTAQSLIQESVKRRMVNRNYEIYGLRRNDHDRNEGQELFSEIMNWPKFSGFLTKF
ncbi:peptidoglycan-recognition protein LD isoform X1 [Lucilia cuprina]|uniref:peptidoglycan-recognition protein LD isoform X1 n=1 Tax=Lucilia cuprina TaxID=7375 RepID=UPI001F05199F|nr:peptidoglycan-recognition protein LD isoform X1 [Lucilia cuprina]